LFCNDRCGHEKERHNCLSYKEDVYFIKKMKPKDKREREIKEKNRKKQGEEEKK
jgi:hypothetical protein